MSLKKHLHLPMACFSLLALSGCAMPGSHIDAKQTADLFADNQVETTQASLDNIDVVAITPSLLAKINQTAVPQRNNPQLDQQLQSYDYHVGVGDVLNITVWDHPELTIPAGAYRSAQDAGNWVHSDGSIFYPYVGTVKVAGMSVIQIRSLIASKLSKYIEDPQLDVSVSAFRSQRIYVTGEVTAPGPVAITNIPLTLLEAVTQAKGLNEQADWKNVVLTRQGKNIKVSLNELLEKGDLAQNYLLQHNDVIHIPRNDFQKVFVMGEVKQPKSLLIQRAGMSLTEALAEVGGINEGTANASGVFIVRANAPGSDKLASVYQMDIR
ncbi:MAG: polysaccharide export protein, partial [Shewanella sp.]